MASSSTTEDKVLSLVVKDADATVKQKAVNLKVSKTKEITKSKVMKPKLKQAKKTRSSKKSPVSPITTPTPVAKVTKKDELIRSVKREPLAHLLIEHMLREAGFRGVVSTDKQLLDRYATDESVFSIRPQIVLQPKNQKDVEVAVKVISKETKRFPSLSLTPRAAGTGLSGGSLTDSVVIDVLPHFTKIDSITEKKGVTYITLEPGVMWRDMEKELTKQGVYLPPYTSSKDICSVGGSIANNAAGPDSLRYGHCADWVESLDVVLADGKCYTIAPINFKEYKALIKKDNLLAKIAKEIFNIIDKNELEIENARPKTKKNSAGYSLWDVISTNVADFKKGKATFDLTRIFSGSQGTIGIITKITLRTLPIQKNTSLIAVPVFDLASASSVVVEALKYNPINIELFDSLTFDLALKNPGFFKDRIAGIMYYKVLLSMYSTYHVRWHKKIPEFVMLITLDNETAGQLPKVIENIKKISGAKARHITNKVEEEMFWQIRRASFSLSKFQNPNKRPAAFLEDMTVPPENLSKFFVEIKRLFKKYNVESAVHGHGGNGHFHFYPLLDFTNQTTPALIMKMAEEFYTTAVKYKGNICGEHNDGIIRTPHLSKIFSKQSLEWFKQVEHIFDPDDIFNPGKKVNPRFDIKESVRKTN